MAATLAMEPPTFTVVSTRQYARLVSRLELAAIPSAVLVAHIHTVDVLRGWGYGATGEVAAAVVSELVANAVRSAHGTPRVQEPERCPACNRPFVLAAWSGLDEVDRIMLTLITTADGVFVEVWDRDPAAPLADDAVTTADSRNRLGRLTKAWNYYRPRGGGKVVWAELAQPEDQKTEPIPRLEKDEGWDPDQHP